MNTKQKMIEAMCAGKPQHVSHGVVRMMLDAALAVLAEDGPTGEFKAIIKSIRNQEPKP